ncbi:hypothetical protein LF296_03240 [Acinetobacter vivianii]|uniref:Uncharacterized protein n=1 Tax=Acinetobacter vivianii TaxID=1776742 RepID=A0AAJ6NK16_9GAMM|nr:hypothetical protein [Acinetobacter vivianii]WDZ51824.1 hypothetical protein LF296_03240 [Acinetobacter vivianii]
MSKRKLNNRPTTATNKLSQAITSILATKAKNDPSPPNIDALSPNTTALASAAVEILNISFLYKKTDHF